MQKFACFSEGRGRRDGNSTGSLARTHVDQKQFQYLHYTENRNIVALLLNIYIPAVRVANDKIYSVAQHYLL
jgi:hypothetical protein